MTESESVALPLGYIPMDDSEPFLPERLRIIIILVSVRNASTFSVLFPYNRHEQHYHRVELQPAGEHVEHENIFRQCGQLREVSGRSDEGETRADVVERRGNGREIRQQVLGGVQRQQEIYCLICCLTIRAIRTTRETLMPPPVDPAQAPINIRSRRMPLDRLGH